MSLYKFSSLSKTSNLFVVFTVRKIFVLLYSAYTFIVSRILLNLNLAFHPVMNIKFSQKVQENVQAFFLFANQIVAEGNTLGVG